jgi:uncharacterized protein (TIGR00369 family)
MALEALLAKIPYVVWHDIRVVRESSRAVKLSLCGREEIANYIGILHAGAIYTLAETAAGCVANNVVEGNIAFVLLRDANIRYTRRADGEISATATVDATAASATRTEFAEHARADIAVDVDVTDGEGETVFNGSFTYALRPRKS